MFDFVHSGIYSMCYLTQSNTAKSNAVALGEISLCQERDNG